MWSFRVTNIALKTNQRVICIVELNTVVMETQQCVSSVSYTYIFCCHKYKYYNLCYGNTTFSSTE